MARMRLIWDKAKGISGMPAEEYYAHHADRVFERGPMVIRDINPYRSIVTGEEIGSRREHREHLKRHDLVEIGNEKLPPRKAKPLPPVKDDFEAAVAMVKQGYKPSVDIAKTDDTGVDVTPND